MRGWVILTAALACSACGHTYWDRLGASEAEFNADNGRCALMARSPIDRATPGPAAVTVYSASGQWVGTLAPTPARELAALGDQLSGASNRLSAHERCLRAHGWQRVR
jgi:hypothetical protein